MDKHKALSRAIALAGGQSELARRLTAILRDQGKLARGKSIKQPHIHYWVYNKPPIEYVPAICEAVDHQVTKHDLRPDFFEAEAA